MTQQNAPKWPAHPDGTPKRMGELTDAQQAEQAAYAIERLRPEFARIGATVSFGGIIPGKPRQH